MESLTAASILKTFLYCYDSSFNINFFSFHKWVDEITQGRINYGNLFINERIASITVSYSIKSTNIKCFYNSDIPINSITNVA